MATTALLAPWVRGRPTATLALLLLSAGVACRHHVTRVLPASIQQDRVVWLERSHGRTVDFDAAGARVLNDSVVGPVAGVHTAVALHDVKQSSMLAYDGTKTTLVVLVALALLVGLVFLGGGLGSRHTGGLY